MGGHDEYAAFAELMAQGAPRLDRALAAIAGAGRSDVDQASLLAELDRIAEGCAASEPAALCLELFGPGRPSAFAGDREHYYDPRNSLLDEVLRRRRGIPISLAVVAIEVGRRRGIDLVGIGMPGHFLIRDADDADAFFDVFAGGEQLDPAGCETRFRALHGPGPTFSAEFLAPTPPPQIVARVLNNLTAAARRAGDRATMVRVLRLSAGLPDASIAARRQLAGSLASAGRFAEAATVHDELSRLDPDAAAEHALAAQRLRARLN